MFQRQNRKIYFLELVLIILGSILVYTYGQAYLRERRRLRDLTVKIEDKDDCIGGTFFDKSLIYSDNLREMQKLALHEEDILDIYPSLQERHVRCNHYLFDYDIPNYEVLPIDGVRVFAESGGRRSRSRWGIYQNLLKYETPEQAELAFAAEISTYPYMNEFLFSEKPAVPSENLREIQSPELYAFQQSKQVCDVYGDDVDCTLIARYGQYISVITFDTSQSNWQERTNELLKASDFRLRQR